MCVCIWVCVLLNTVIVNGGEGDLYAFTVQFRTYIKKSGSLSFGESGFDSWRLGTRS